jgi:hypothetical protein
MMQLVGQAIRHETFGKGIITDWDERMLTVCFPSGDKKFLYPDAFARHLTLKNSAMQNKIQRLLNAQAAKKEAELQAVQQAQEKRRLLHTMKISPNSQAVLDIPAEQEKEVFSTWSVSTGHYLSGYSKGDPRIPNRLKPNSLCLLTRREDGTPEQERRIIGAFMVEEDFWGTDCCDGVVNAHPAYRIALTQENVPAFWPYIAEDPAKQRWGHTKLKYFSNRTAEKILFDIRELCHTKKEKDAVEQFYQYFCRLNRLTPRKEQEEEPCS